MINIKFFVVTSAVFMVGITLSSCFTGSVLLPSARVTNENRARKMQDFDRYYPKGSYELDFKIGDRFKLKQPMYLYLANTGIVQLHETSWFAVPPVKEYLANPDKFKFGGRNNFQIIRLVPPGEVIHLVAIKNSSQAGFLPYFVFEGKDEWFRSSTFLLSRHTGDHSYTYDPEFFTKLRASR